MTLTTPTLDTARLHLRPFTEADSEALFALLSDAEVLQYWDSPPWADRSRVQDFLAGCARMAEEGSGARVVVERSSDGAFLGWCTLNSWDPTFRSASLGYCFAAAAWGHGYATEAARALLDWAFDVLDLNRVQAEADTRNGASARVLEKLGFLREGMLREDCIVDGVLSDSWVYGLLRRDRASATAQVGQTTERLTLRFPLPEDEAQAAEAQRELAEDGFNLLLGNGGASWDECLRDAARDRLGEDLAPGRVPATMLFAVVGDRIVGRVHLRHTLTPALLQVGGNIGYGVRPADRRRGYATEMLRQACTYLAGLGVSRALVTCDDDKLASIRTIERNGGVLEDVVANEHGDRKRRYWIDLGR